MDMTKLLGALSLTKPAVNAAQQQAYRLHVMDAQESGQKPLPFERWLAAQGNALAAPPAQQAPQQTQQNQLAEPVPFRF